MNNQGYINSDNNYEVNNNADTRDTFKEEILKIRRQNIEHRNAYWSEEDHKQLKQMYLDGVGISEMAVYFGRSEVAIVCQINKLLLCTNVRQPRQRNDGCKCPSCSLNNNCPKVPHLN